MNAANRLYSQQAQRGSEHYSIVQDVSFVRSPFAQAYASSSDSNMDASIASEGKSSSGRDRSGFEPSQNMMSMVNDKPWKLRTVIPEYKCQIVMERKNGRPDETPVFTLQKGLRERDYAPTSPQSKPGTSDRTREQTQDNNSTSLGDSEVTCKEWSHVASFLAFNEWLSSTDGRLTLPLLKRDTSLSLGRDRAVLRQLLTEIGDTLPYESAGPIIYLYSLARNLSITPLETHLAEKWRQSFDVMPEHPHIYLWALGILRETSSVDDDPLASRLINQLAYSVLWKTDVAVHTAGNLPTADQYLQRVSGLSMSILTNFAPDLAFLADRLTVSMTKIVLKVAARQPMFVCDFVGTEPHVIYEEVEGL